jgi:ABC-type multidrug transport system ATPase subunit
MNVLSGHYANNLLIPTGNVYINGISITDSQRQRIGSIGYVEQQEFFIETLTLEEHLTFQVKPNYVFYTKKFL